MPIVSSEIIKSWNKGRGKLSVFERHIDHNGKPHPHHYCPPVGHDIGQALLDWVPILEKELIDGDKRQYQAAIEEGSDPSTIVTKHLSNLQKLKRLVKALMRGEDRKVLKALDFIDNLTSAQRQSAVNQFTAEQIVIIQGRLQQLRDNRAFLDNDTRDEL